MIEVEGSLTDRQVFEIWARMLGGDYPKKVQDEALLVLYDRSCYALCAHDRIFTARFPDDLKKLALEYVKHGEPYTFRRLRL